MTEFIPAHLKKFDWYPGHLAWIRDQGFIPRHDPGDEAPCRAELKGADLSEVDLTGVDLRWADLSGANLTRTNLVGAYLWETNLSMANLRWANLKWARLFKADLYRADLTGADLAGANLGGAALPGAVLTGAHLAGTILSGTFLVGAVGIRKFGPVGAENRTIYGVAYEGGAQIQAGCFWGTAEETRQDVLRKYADGSGREHLRAEYLKAIGYVGDVSFVPDS